MFPQLNMRKEHKHGYTFPGNQTIWKNKQNKTRKWHNTIACLHYKRETRFELAALALARRCSTTEPFAHKSGAVEGT